MMNLGIHRITSGELTRPLSLYSSVTEKALSCRDILITQIDLVLLPFSSPEVLISKVHALPLSFQSTFLENLSYMTFPFKDLIGLHMPDTPSLARPYPFSFRIFPNMKLAFRSIYRFIYPYVRH